jgi:hypothetical protein
MPAASELSESPMVETNWPVHNKVNERLRKTENIEGCWREAVVMHFPPCQN